MSRGTKKKRHGRDARGTENRFRLAALRAAIKPFRLHWFSRLRSTNDHAAAMRKAGELFAPAAVLTGHQLAGRGRGAHAWWSSAGCLTITFVFPIYEHHEPYHIPLLAGLAVRNAAAELGDDDSIQLKWPNDVVHNGRKLAGLLCERVAKADLVGIGLNVNVDSADAPPDLRARVTSLAHIAGNTFDITKSTATLARHLLGMLSQPQHSMSHMLKQYDEHHSLIGRKVTVLNSPGEPAVSGICQGLDSIGRLLLRDRSTVHHVVSGQVLV